MLYSRTKAWKGVFCELNSRDWHWRMESRDRRRAGVPWARDMRLLDAPALAFLSNFLKRNKYPKRYVERNHGVNKYSFGISIRSFRSTDEKFSDRKRMIHVNDKNPDFGLLAMVVDLFVGPFSVVYASPKKNIHQGFLIRKPNDKFTTATR